MAKGTEQFKETIKKYLDSIAEIDDAFAAKYAAEGKSIDGCVEYIIGQVQKSGCAGFDDAEIYGMAVHYYEEEDLGEYPKGNVASVVVNHHIELTEEEKEEARQKAIQAYEQEQVRKLQEKERKEKEAAKKKAEEAKKRAEELAAGTGSLFDF